MAEITPLLSVAAVNVGKECSHSISGSSCMKVVAVVQGVLDTKTAYQILVIPGRDLCLLIIAMPANSNNFNNLFSYVILSPAYEESQQKC